MGMENFNPRSYKRSDKDFSARHSSILYFNPRSYKRSDESADRYFHAIRKISIHAPTRGATRLICQTGLWTPDFNPRSYKRSDACFSSSVRSSIYFNPRSYKRSDFSIIVFPFQDHNFNPRSYKRSDDGMYPYPFSNIISIHAPTRGATFTHLWLSSTIIRFQSTLLQEERQIRTSDCRIHRNFNPRSYKRSDHFHFLSTLQLYLFQSTLLQEERRKISNAHDG